MAAVIQPAAWDEGGRRQRLRAQAGVGEGFARSGRHTMRERRSGEGAAMAAKGGLSRALALLRRAWCGGSNTYLDCRFDE